MPLSNQFSIHDAAEAAGLTPSVIRVWEERYGWPSPKRHPNGYRAFAAHEIEELKRAAVLVRDGMPIGKLIIDGFPVWPDEHKRSAVKQHDLTQTKSLPVTGLPLNFKENAPTSGGGNMGNSNSSSGSTPAGFGQLDIQSLQALNEVKQALNLSSDTEALRALIALGYKQFKKL